ncbi:MULTISPECIES: hypothetical protein [unclassified Agrococcus]|uniref:hypothetical protein n=1 Tax=unclassified Agrococcus TaxID=2615065 RepID=UPI00360D371D
MSDPVDAAGGDAVGRGRLPGEGQRPVRAPRERQVAPRWWILGGGALVAVAVLVLSTMAATGVALPATTAVLLVAIPVGIGVAMRGLALRRRARDAAAAPRRDRETHERLDP